jgi:hypothetical protein
MIGVLTWKTPSNGKKQKQIMVGEKSILHMRVWQAEIQRGDRTPETLLRRRIALAQKKLRKHGVTRIILPKDFSDCEMQKGLQVVSTLAMRQMLATGWVQRELSEQGIRPAGAKVAVVADRFTGEVVRTVTELAMRHRYVLLDVPHGGEELCRRLRREYGVSLLLQPDRAQINEAEALVLFSPRQDLERKNPVILPIYDEEVAMPPLALAPVLEEKLPQGANRVQLLAALLQTGVIRVGADLTF